MMTNHEEFENLAALDSIGALDANEALKLEQHLEICDQCREAADEYVEAASVLALAAPPVIPPDAVRAGILESIQEREAAVEIRDRKTPTWWLAAAAVFFVALFAWSELRNRMMRERVEEMQASTRSTWEQNRRLEANNERMARQLEKLTSPETRMIALTGEAIAPTAKARIFMDEQEHTALVFFENLPPNGADKNYELWVVRADRPNPVPAGVFEADGNGKAQVLMKNLPADTEIKAIAVTLEPKDGTAAPEGERYMVGAL